MGSIVSDESFRWTNQTEASLEWRRFLYPECNISRELSWGNELTIPRMVDRNHPQLERKRWSIHSLFNPNGEY